MPVKPFGVLSLAGLPRYAAGDYGERDFSSGVCSGHNGVQGLGELDHPAPDHLSRGRAGGLGLLQDPLGLHGDG